MVGEAEVSGPSGVTTVPGSMLPAPIRIDGHYCGELQPGENVRIDIGERIELRPAGVPIAIECREDDG